MNKKRLLTSALFFIVLLLLLRTITPKKAEQPAGLTLQPIAISVGSTSYTSGDEVIVKAKNNTTATLTIDSRCPKAPIDAFSWNGSTFVAKEATTIYTCDKIESTVIPPQEEKAVSLKYWNHELFGEPGRYKVAYTANLGTTTATFETQEFSVSEAGIFKKGFRAVLYQPLYNVLIGLIDFAPGHDLGFAIIILTIIVRLILLVPSQKAIISQKRLQEVQPHLEKIKKEFAGNQERIAHETMQLWKQHKVNPFGSCLPLLLQFPVLIALFYVIQGGLNPDNAFMLYGPLKSFDLNSIHTNFLGILDLTSVNRYVLPLIVGALQFLQLKLTMGKKAKEKKPALTSEMESANKSMTYIMPVMIALFTASVPAGVGLYWGVSTLFAIGQQIYANRT